MMTLPEQLDLLHGLGTWSLEVLWLPMLAWTLAVLPALALLRWVTPHPLAGYRARQALLFALPLGLLLAATTDWTLPFPAPAPAAGIVLEPPVVLAPASATSLSDPLTWWHALGGLTLVAALLAAWRLARLTASACRLVRYRRTLTADAPAPLQAAARKAAKRLDIRRRFRLAQTPGETAPMTLGPLRPVIVFPPGLAGERLQMTLAHELVHVRRRDDRTAWLEALTGALFFVHPLCALLRRQIADGREAACDAAVLEDCRFSPRRYARLLYAFASPARASSLALPLTESSSSFKSRLHAMHRLSPAPSDRSALALAAALLLGVTVGLTACSDTVTPGDAPQETAQVQDASESTSGVVAFSEIDTKPSLEGGPASIYNELRYPESAYADNVEGTVFLQFVVGADGNVRDTKVLRSPAKSLSQEALRVIEMITFEPGQRNGQPVPVRMTQPIRFKL